MLFKALEILEFLRNSKQLSSPSPFGGSLYGILEFHASLRGLKKREQSRSKFRLEFRHCENHRHCERSEAISRNSRILYYVILGLDPRISIRNFRILCDEIPRSSRGMTKNASRGNFYRDCPVKPDNDTSS